MSGALTLPVTLTMIDLLLVNDKSIKTLNCDSLDEFKPEYMLESTLFNLIFACEIFRPLT